jgi:hypothetical protein
MGNHVKIPLSLMAQTINLLEQWDISDYEPSLQEDYGNVYFAFLKKRQSLELRDAYAKIIFAEDDESRFQARLRYLQQKRTADEF